MPTINAFYRDEETAEQLEKLTSELNQYAAEQLTCGDIILKPEEVSVRLIHSSGKGMLAQLELEVTAAAFKERVEKQDEICLNVQKFIIDKTDLRDVKVWLILSELGHSWE